MDFSLNEEQRGWQLEARRFALEEIRAVSLQRDQIAEPEATLDWDIIRKGSRLGFRTAALKAKEGWHEFPSLEGLPLANYHVTSPLSVISRPLKVRTPTLTLCHRYSPGRIGTVLATRNGTGTFSNESIHRTVTWSPILVRART